ncbi:prolyl oligopeptidase family serine peptidase [Flavobacterium azooxidireducens]|uniref:Prolyl oligopeptidase family serine peptidase n=1 Tax=Flavobacterium azooxidireducens TaxID=1871076 RepID=A0ABY4KC02_9FLAO|nr:prolyl oligopeptidase family serine peptidase [Flavobacterium azooxidireducens]UPQ78309.1 prolyl oligopeptidase family serine peptidase [Flavobacterium azooxidireducens]
MKYIIIHNKNTFQKSNRFWKVYSTTIQVLICILMLFSVTAQTQTKKKLTEQDYHKWGDIHLKEVSSDGKWISYNVNYSDQKDTLIVKSTSTNKTYTFPNGYNGSFSNSNWFAAKNPTGISLLNLKSGKKLNVNNGNAFGFSNNGKLLIYCSKESANSSKLEVIEVDKSKTVLSINGVFNFKFNPEKDKIIFNRVNEGKSTAEIISLNTLEHKTITPPSEFNFHGFEWSKNGKGIVFFKKVNPKEGKQQNTIFLYSVDTNKKSEFNTVEHPDFPPNSAIVPFGNYKLAVSDDLQRVVFAVDSPQNNNTSQSTVQIWAGNAPWIFPEQQVWDTNNTAKMAIWFPQKNTFRLINDKEFPWIMFTPDFKQAILSNKKMYEPQFDVALGPMDFYIENLATKQREIMLTKQSSYVQVTLPSPKGRFIAYFKESNWWIYNVESNTHSNITASLKSDFETIKSDRPTENTALGCPGWTANDKSILLYDRFDIWEINPINGNAERLTKGKEQEIQFRFSKEDNGFDGKANYDGWVSDVVNLEGDIFLNAIFKNGSKGLYSWTRSDRERKLTTTFNKINQIKSNNNTVVYKEQSYDLPPQIVAINPNVKRKVIARSNKHHSNYQWPKVKEIEYVNSKNQKLKGFLYFPVDYKAEQKYPMIVHIYEKQSYKMHNYIVPETYSSEGFNVIDFSVAGYFVFFPDITYEIGNLGHSAVDCTLAGTKAVIDMGIVDEKKIGLIGHSFGGYETDFIITQTDVFATAVAGAAATDMRSFYLTLNWQTGKPDMWRFENQQWRMGKSYFEDKIGYEKNSPLNHIENIKTPLLSWAGNQDKQVDWRQSIEFYLAMRRLNKKHILLLYDGESHSITNDKNQKDLSVRIKQWFNHFLKDDQTQDWILDSIK